MIRFEREGEERFAHWIGGTSWRSHRSLHRLFAEAESDLVDNGETGVGAAPRETLQCRCDTVKTMRPDELDSFERRTFATWDRASLGDLRRAIARRRRKLALLIFPAAH